MKKHLATAVLLNIFISTLLVAQRQPYPSLRDVRVNTVSTFNYSEQMYYYAYTITNSKSSLGDVATLEVDISRDSNTLDLDTIGLRFKNDGYTERAFRRNIPRLRMRIVSMSFLKTPPGRWTGGFSNGLTASINGVGEDHILPGQTLSGFELMSKGLPGIRRFTASPYFDVIALFPDPNDTTVTYYVPPVDSVRQAVKFRGWTIGPTAPPIDFIPTIWCDTLLSYTRQSVQLGWLKTTRDDDCDDDEQPNDGIAKNIEKRIEKAKRELIKGDSLKARKELEKLVKKVEKIFKRSEELENAALRHPVEREKKREHEITMTSEAYALLKYNTEYLLERLPEKNRKRQ